MPWRRLNATKPVLIVIPGDIFQGSDHEFSQHEAELVRLLDELSAPLGVYVVQGNSDRPWNFSELMRKTRVV